jgi:hypothetical protein
MTIRGEESQAAERLVDFLRTTGRQQVSWIPGSDPPDLVFTVDCQRWAVEVTRTNQQVRTRTRNFSMSRHGLDETLTKLGCTIKNDVANHCRHYYTLHLSAPASEDLESYRRRVRGAVVKHIKAGSTATLRLDPGELAAHAGTAPGIGVIVGSHKAHTPSGGQLTDVAANLREMLEEAWERKRPKFESLQGYDKRAMILFNQYLFADPHDVAALLPHVIGEAQQIELVFFWSGVSFDGGGTFAQVYP